MKEGDTDGPKGIDISQMTNAFAVDRHLQLVVHESQPERVSPKNIQPGVVNA